MKESVRCTDEGVKTVAEGGSEALLENKCLIPTSLYTRLRGSLTCEAMSGFARSVKQKLYNGFT